jgi:small-conductance mechanosensitive channel
MMRRGVQPVGVPLASPCALPLRWGVPKNSVATRRAPREVIPARPFRSANKRSIWLAALLFSCLVLAAPRISAQTSSQSNAPAVAATDPARIVQFLDQAISWYRQLGAQQQLVTGANDAVYMSANRQMADQVVRLALQFAYAEEEAQPQTAPAQQTSGQGTAASPYQALMQQQVKAQQDENQVLGEVADLQKKIVGATGKKKEVLEAQLGETQAEVDLAKARVDALRNMAEFMSGASTDTTGLSAQIEALESTVPADLRPPANGASAGAGANNAASQPQVAATNNASVATGSGLLATLESLFATWGKLRSIDGAIEQTQALARSAQDIRSPMTNRLRALTQQGDVLAQQAGTANTATLDQEKQQLDALTQQFKQLTAAAIPIAQAGILLGLYEKNLANWHSSVAGDLLTESRGLLIRLAVLVVIVALVLGASELWRRAIHRYVHDSHRRWQLHWVRKLVVWAVIGVVVTLSLVSQIGSMATFAGLITAGVAVSLQNVIQSVVGYFFLIGKYGIRVGDRVMIGGVTGEVIDVGLVRIHLMEMGGAGADTPTGRVVAFSNSIVFQPTSGLFKQIPGTSFSWHEITLTLPVDINFAEAREKLMKATESGLADYKDEIAKQHSALEDTFEGAPGLGLQPTVQLQFTSSGLEALVRYPVSLRHAAEIDERVTRAVMSGFDLSHSATPAIRLKTVVNA